jgi:hypothetical protein
MMASNNSNPSSEVSIEEIGPEEAPAVAKDADAQEIVTDERGPTAEGANKSSGDGNDKEPARLSGLPPGVEIILRSDDEDDIDEEDDDDLDDETLWERLIGLSEMFPEPVRNGTSALANGSVSGVKWLYGATRGLSWIVFRYDMGAFLLINFRLF